LVLNSPKKGGDIRIYDNSFNVLITA
jgi:hypothetical protein